MLGVEEGIHFNWHLQGRGRKHVVVVLTDERGQAFSRSELPLKGDSQQVPDFVITGASISPGAGWKLQKVIQTGYWMNQRSFECRVWIPSREDNIAAASTE
jgi:hypothetical protein